MPYPTVAHTGAIAWVTRWRQQEQLSVLPPHPQVTIRPEGDARDWDEIAVALVTELESLLKDYVQGGGRDIGMAAERSLRGVALGRKSWLFCGSERGGDRTASMYTLITTAKLNDVDPQAWLADVLARIADLPLSRLPELLPWAWARQRDTGAIAA
jgi:hypothetical protein